MLTLSFSTRLERLVYFILVYLLAFSTYQISGAYIFIKITRKIKIRMKIRRKPPSSSSSSLFAIFIMSV